MRPQSHIGITGFISRKEVEAVFGSGTQKWKSPLQAGVLVSSKSLAGLPQENVRRFPKREVLPTIFADMPNTLNLLHFNTNRPEQLTDDLLKAHELAGPFCHGFQLNIRWPDIRAIEEYRKVHPGAKITLQCGSGALKELDDLEHDLPARVREYGNLINYVMIDESGGKGVVFDYQFMRCAFESLQDIPDIGLIVAGGLSFKNLYRLHPLWRKFREFSIDVESGVRNEQDDLDIGAVRIFLQIADTVFARRALSKAA